MKQLEQIKKPVAAELENFDVVFREAMRSRIPLLDKVTAYIMKTKGKQMRPLFVLLSAKISGDINDSTYRALS